MMHEHLSLQHCCPVLSLYYLELRHDSRLRSNLSGYDWIVRVVWQKCGRLTCSYYRDRFAASDASGKHMFSVHSWNLEIISV